MVSVEVLKDNNSTIINFGADSKTDDAHQEEADRSCKVCGFGPCTTRCSLCKSVYYCSVECQRKDWTKGGHKINCNGRQKSKKGDQQTKNPNPMGPSLPPPTSVHNEHDAKRALEELFSITESAMSGGEQHNNVAEKIKPKLSSTNTNRPQSKTKAPTPMAQPDTNRSTLGGDNLHEDTNSMNGTIERESENTVSFVVEEMPQICRFQLTLTTRRKRQRNEMSNTHSSYSHTSIAVSAEPIGRARSRTLVTVRETEGNCQELFVGEFPRPIQKSDITWTICENINSDIPNDGNPVDQDDVVIILRLPYPYDVSNTSSMALGGSLDDSYNDASRSESTLDEINSVVCGTCHLPLITMNGEHKPISRAFPLPQGHWDEIADYLICYDGQPMIDFSTGSECAEPSIALQDSSLLCFHRKDVEATVCALAVDGYGELTEEMESETNRSATQTNLDDNDLGTFFTKPASSSFVLPTESKSIEETKEATNDNTNKDEPEISATSAVVRGDRTWQDAVDGESVSLCCARCCSPLGFCSLGSPETWRFWKHRLSIPETTPRTQQNNELPNMKYPMALPLTKPLAACSSFLARELVRYAESKAIFTFVVRREGVNLNSSSTNIENECLLLRLLSWETAMATSFDSNRKSKALRFCKVAKIVFELASDPTITRQETKHDTNGEVPTQWFWGGVDLCCPPAGSTSTATDDAPLSGAVSTVRLQLPSDDYDSVLEDFISNKALFEPEIAKATILLKMGGLSEGLGLTAVPLH